MAASHVTDAFIPREFADLHDGHQAAEDLVRCGLWERARGGWRMLQDVPSVRGGIPEKLWRIERADVRRKIPPWLRDFVFDRDGRYCAECGSTEDLTLDHIYPWSRGGQDVAENLRVLCRSCNSSKGAQV